MAAAHSLGRHLATREPDAPSVMVAWVVIPKISDDIHWSSLIGTDLTWRRRFNIDELPP